MVHKERGLVDDILHLTEEAKEDEQRAVMDNDDVLSLVPKVIVVAAT